MELDKQVKCAGTVNVPMEAHVSHAETCDYCGAGLAVDQKLLDEVCAECAAELLAKERRHAREVM